ncbi:hypothetical protein SAY86_002638 [Trapa natans]|uniref:Uncharacterized protein n=1 Tax=Trapa natans TaxID=22666 RepID=A0AAN7LJI8_TRANT|nr:hypothetical protein SAY86_002638 [Trapa natans]
MKMRRQWSSCDDGGGRNECPAAEAARNPAKLPISAVNFTKEISLTAKDTVQQLPISGTGSLHQASILGFRFPSTYAGNTEAGILCEPCNGKGWLICDFCKGQKTNVKAENKRTYRRCPSCRALCHQ